MIFIRVAAAALVACCGRAIVWPNACLRASWYADDPSFPSFQLLMPGLRPVRIFLNANRRYWNYEVWVYPTGATAFAARFGVRWFKAHGSSRRLGWQWPNRGCTRFVKPALPRCTGGSTCYENLSTSCAGGRSTCDISDSSPLVGLVRSQNVFCDGGIAGLAVAFRCLLRINALLKRTNLRPPVSLCRTGAKDCVGRVVGPMLHLRYRMCGSQPS
jgi:hypothetical protein